MADSRFDVINRMVPAIYRSDPARRTQASILLAVLLFDNSPFAPTVN